MSGSIRAIDDASIHRITSGQVIVDLQTAVKELVENSLDAGATSIEVRCKDSGSVSFEVIDNGTGIAPCDYATVALKSHTSKLNTYDDLLGVSSFGFRGEALASLCQLADVSITTATADEEPLGTVLSFGRQGKLLDSTKKVARQRGTTVAVTDLFATVPVRRKEFEKNVKRHFGNVQTLLQAYCLINIHCKITLSNQAGSKPYQTLFKSDGRTLRENFATLFTAKTALTLLDVDVPLNIAEEAVTDDAIHIRLKGLLSRPEAAAGRTSGDRQFFYVNGRPFDGKSIAKAVNETFKQYAGSHFPVAVLDIVLSTAAYDVNVSPDKRTIFLHSERILLEAVKTAIDGIYQPFRSTYTLNATHMTQASARDRKATQSSLANARQSQESPSSSSSADSPPPSEADRRVGRPVSVSSNDIDGDIVMLDSPRVRSHATSSSEDNAESTSRAHRTEHSRVVTEDGPPADMVPAAGRAVMAPSQQSPLNADSTDGADPDAQSRRPKKVKLYHPEPVVQASIIDYAQSLAKDATAAQTPPLDRDLGDGYTRQTSARPSDSSFSSESVPELASQIEFSRGDIQLEEFRKSRNSDSSEIAMMMPNGGETSIQARHGDPVDDSEVGLFDDRQLHDTTITATQQTLAVDIVSIRHCNKRKRSEPESSSVQLEPGANDELEAAGVAADDAKAQQALTRLISKTDFAQMSVVGQFNLSFIIARRRHSADQHDDLMIIDQHASDEKWNFERLQQVTKIDSQKLLQPRIMNLPASDELIAIENEAILRFNGFDIEVDDDASTGQRIKLLTLPVSKSTKKLEFAISDFEELLFLLRDHTSNCMIRPTKTRKLFAMLACRSSVMVGKVLSKAQMTSIVRHMGLMDQPWNCPHGRNTMRWLAGLSMPKPDGRYNVSSDSFTRLLG